MMTTDKGRIYHFGQMWAQLTTKRLPGESAAAQDARVGARAPEKAAQAFLDQWGNVTWGAWSFLWERKRKVLWTWGPFRFTGRRFRGLWDTLFGPCPFSWKLGPNV